MTTSLAAEAATTPRTLPDRLLGLVGAIMIVLALVALVVGGEEDGAGSPAGAVPVITLLEPVDGAVVEGPVRLNFRTPADLRRMPMGWGTGDLHLHLMVDSLQFMPAAPDVRPLPDGSYQWVVPALSPGTHRIRFFWSDATHRPIEQGGSPEVVVRAR